ncbi:alpha/beta fold hydrolase [Nocardiopsis salina]|uniref:alpha/beta fold hydrolase n=1 Tax=Nocardiopsis salina TaxID=245836 RepID=UPI0003491DA8|nr:alpha/beta hydrolase [Nocardiopsis salina]
MSAPTIGATAETIVRTDDGARIAVTDLTPLAPAPDGTGAATVVLAHGWAASRRVWGTVADRLLRSGHRVVLYDQRGHGFSEPGSDPIGVERLGRDLTAVLEAMDAVDAIAVAHSGGGFAALAHATAAPEAAARRLGGLVLVNSAAHGAGNGDGEVRMMGSRLFSRALAAPRLGRRLLRHTMGRRADPRALEVNRQMFAATPARVRADCFGCSGGMDLRGALPSVILPTTVLAGSEDRVISPDLGRTIAETLPRARFESVPGTGHMLPLEAPVRVAGAVRELASEVFGLRAPAR